MSQLVVIEKTELAELITQAVHKALKLAQIMQNNPIKEYPMNMREKTASEYMNISPSTLRTWRCRGTGPAYNKLRGVVSYSKKDLDKFIEQRKVSIYEK